MQKWPYENVTEPKPYGAIESYEKAIAWLDGHGTIVDWGCGTGYARRFVKQSRYVGIDGTYSVGCDLVANLEELKIQSDCVLMRHVLEHSEWWESILVNAVSGFRQRLALVFFIPLHTQPHRTAISDGGRGDGYPYLMLPKLMVEPMLKDYGWLGKIDRVPATGGRTEFIYYLEKK